MIVSDHCVFADVPWRVSADPDLYSIMASSRSFALLHVSSFFVVLAHDMGR